jgi:class 3 adenylate cyclase
MDVNNDEIRRFVRQCIQRAMASSNARFSSKEVKLAEAIPGYEETGFFDFIQKEMAVLFIDMVGSTQRAERIGDQKMFVTVHAFLPAMTLLVHRLEGVVPKFTGDGLLALFGYEPSQTDLSRAVCHAAACAGTMRDVIYEIVNPEMEKVRIPRMDCGMGIDAGKIVVTRIGIHQANEVTVFGDAVNQAAKLASKRNPASIYISQRAHSAADAATKYALSESWKGFLSAKETEDPSVLRLE